MMTSESIDAVLGFGCITFTLIGFARVFWTEAKRSMRLEFEELSRALLEARANSRHWQQQAQTLRHTARVSRGTTDRLLELVERQRHTTPFGKSHHVPELRLSRHG